MNRREFLKTLALTGVAATLKWDGMMDLMAQGVPGSATGCDLVAVMGGEPAAMFRKAIGEFGGMGKFVKAGQKVVVKPMGIVWDRGFFHKNDLQQCIADICTMDKPAVLNVVDAYRMMKTNGPRGKSDADVVTTKSLFVSTDIVAVDTAATKFFNQIEKMPLEVVGHLAKGEELKIGTMNIDSLQVERIKM